LPLKEKEMVTLRTLQLIVLAAGMLAPPACTDDCGCGSDGGMDDGTDADTDTDTDTDADADAGVDGSGGLFLTGISEGYWSGPNGEPPLQPFTATAEDMFILKLQP
jgi:hypothetical protein